MWKKKNSLSWHFYSTQLCCGCCPVILISVCKSKWIHKDSSTRHALYYFSYEHRLLIDWSIFISALQNGNTICMHIALYTVGSSMWYFVTNSKHTHSYSWTHVGQCSLQKTSTLFIYRCTLQVDVLCYCVAKHKICCSKKTLVMALINVIYIHVNWI